jgi:predicted HicB family RNase H-like nuclease
MSEEKKLVIRIDGELRKAARIKALEEDRTLSEVVRQFLRAWLRGELPTPLPEGDKEEE